MLSCNIASVYVSDEETLDVPFPTHVIDDSVTGYSKKIPVTCDFSTLEKYYKFFENIKITKDTIELNSNKIKYIIQYDSEKSEVILSKESSNFITKNPCYFLHKKLEYY